MNSNTPKMNFFKSFYNSLLLFACISMLGLIYVILKLPSEIAENSGKVIYKTETVVLKSKQTFIYFSGILQDSSILISENYNYDVEYPESIWNGYLTRYKGTDKSDVFIWSQNKIDNHKVDGWFFTDNIGIFPVEKELNLKVLYPVTSSSIEY